MVTAFQWYMETKHMMLRLLTNTFCQYCSYSRWKQDSKVTVYGVQAEKEYLVMLFILGTVVSIVTHLLSKTLYIVSLTLHSEITVSKEMRDWR